MLGTYIEIILYPVKKYLDMLMDATIRSHLGVSVLAIAVTGAISLILVNALVYRINAGGAAGTAFRVKSYQDQVSLNQQRAAAKANYKPGYYQQSTAQRASIARSQAMNRRH